MTPNPDFVAQVKAHFPDISKPLVVVSGGRGGGVF